MEKELILKAEVREQTGSKCAGKLRKSGRIPAVVYGHKQEPVAISIDMHSFVEALHHGRRLMDVQIDKHKQKILVKDLQYDHLGKDIIHVDMMRVDVTETVKVAVPIELKGTAKGTHDGGVVEKHMDHLEVECRATDIPETIVVSVKELGVDDVLYARDIGLPEGVKLASSPEALLVTCHVVVAPKTTEEIEEQAPVAPEVISEVKEEEEPSGEEP
jgi:large subunit ribosomal protein L25